MVKRTYSMPENEPDQKTFQIPSEKEHLFQIVDVYDEDHNEYNLNLDANKVCVKLEVVGGEEEGRSILHFLSLDSEWKGFFVTRLFLKSIGEQYKGEKVDIDTDEWVGKQFFATVVHSTADNGKTYANINEYNFEKLVEKPVETHQKTDNATVKWDE